MIIKKLSGRRGIALGVMLAMLAVTPVVSAGAREEGYRLYRQGDYKGAMRRFSLAYRRTKKVGLLYNIAKCNEKLGYYAEAINFYRKYLKAAPGASDRADVEQIIAALNVRMAASSPEIEFVSSPPGAQVRIAGKFAGQTPFKVHLTPGKYTVIFILRGHDEIKRELTVDPGKRSRLAVLLSPVAKTGRLKVLASVKGARISVDGELIGLTPQQSPAAVPLGNHIVRVERRGFRPWQKAVRIELNQEQAVFADLQAESISAKAVLGWIALGLAGASEGLAWVFYSMANDRYEGTSEFERDRGLSIGLHIGAATLASVAGVLLIWSALEPGSSLEQPQPSRAGFGIGLTNVSYRW